LSRGWRNVLYSVSFFVFTMLSVNSRAQAVSDAASIKTLQSKVVVSGPKPSAGDLITGCVTGPLGPMMMVNVLERDSKDRLMAHALTDINGNFSFKLVDPADRLEVIYVGYHTAVSEFTGNAMNVKMAFDGITEVDSTLAAMLPVIREDRYQGMRARAYGPQYPKDGKPLIVLDGSVIILNSDKRADFDFANDSFSRKEVARLLDIKPKQIKSISFLKDDKATAFWGSRGANGVLEIKSKDFYRRMKKEGNQNIDKQ